MTVRLDRQVQDLLSVMSASGFQPLHTLTVEQARQRMRDSLVRIAGQPALHDVRDVPVPTPNGPLGMRLYRPGTGRLPLALFFHGGGWTVNDLDTHDELCRRLAKRSGWLLASLDYRRAPEHKHPAALEDAYHAYRWLLDNATAIDGDTSSLALVGESAGATTVAALALLLRDCGAPLPTYQAMAYPMMDIHDRWSSRTTYGAGYGLDAEQIRWFRGNFLPAAHDLRDPYLFPLAGDDLSGLPPALIMTAGFDPLRDEGMAFAEKLTEAGVEVDHHHAEDQIHGFLLLGRVVAKAGELVDRLGDALAAHARQARGQGTSSLTSRFTAAL